MARGRKSTGGTLVQLGDGKHGRDARATIRGRLLPAAHATATAGQAGAPYTFLRNEPTVLAAEISRIMPMTNYLWRLHRVFAGGFVSENKPNLGGVLRAFSWKMSPFQEETEPLQESRQ